MSAKDIRNLLDQFNSIEKTTLTESASIQEDSNDTNPYSGLSLDALEEQLEEERRKLRYAKGTKKPDAAIKAIELKIEKIQAAINSKTPKSTHDQVMETWDDPINNTDQTEVKVYQDSDGMWFWYKSRNGHVIIQGHEGYATEKEARLAANSNLMEKWVSKMKTPKKKKGMFAGKTVAALKAELKKLKASGPHKKGSEEYTKQQEVTFAIRAKTGWGKVTESDTEFSTLVDLLGAVGVAIFGINILKKMWTYRGPEDLDESDETPISKEQFVERAIGMLKKHRGYDLHPDDLAKITQMFETIYDEKELGHRDQAAVTAAIRVVMPNASTREISDAVKTAAADPNKSLMENVVEPKAHWTKKGQEAIISDGGKQVGIVQKSTNGETWSAYSNTTKKSQRGFKTSQAAINWVKKEYLDNTRQPSYNGDHEKRINVSESNTAGNSIDLWMRNNPSVDARTLEKLVHDIGYRDLEEFFGDNPDAVAAVMEFVVSAIDHVPEWQSHMRSSVNDMGEPLDEMFNFSKKHNVDFIYVKSTSSDGNVSYDVSMKYSNVANSKRYIGYIKKQTAGWIAAIYPDGRDGYYIKSSLYEKENDAKKWIERQFEINVLGLQEAGIAKLPTQTINNSMRAYEFILNEQTGSQTFYHMSPSESRHNIERLGLLVMIKKYTQRQRIPGVYMFRRFEDVCEWATWSRPYREPTDIWRISLPKDWTVFDDPALDMQRFHPVYSTNPIPPSAISRIPGHEIRAYCQAHLDIGTGNTRADSAEALAALYPD